MHRGLFIYMSVAHVKDQLQSLLPKQLNSSTKERFFLGLAPSSFPTSLWVDPAAEEGRTERSGRARVLPSTVEVGGTVLAT